MAKEIERKYLVLGDAWRGLPAMGAAKITQAYVRKNTPIHIVFNKTSVQSGAGTVVFAVGVDNDGNRVCFSAPNTDDFAAVSTLPNYDAATGRLTLDPATIFRIRIADDKAAWVTVKRQTGKAGIKDEYELPIPLKAAQDVQTAFCESFVEKTRHVVMFHGAKWEVDEFSGPLTGLVMAEVEVDDESAFDGLTMLPGVVKDVTTVPGVGNESLGRHGIPPALKGVSKTHNP